MPALPAYKANATNWRLDSVGRLIDKYKSNPALLKCWEALLAAGIPAEMVNPAGASDPRPKEPADSFVSEFILRAYESANDRGGHGNDPFPRIGFKADLRAIAYNLDRAAELLIAGPWGLEAITPDMLPVDWLHFGAELARMRAEPGSANVLAELDREMRAEANRYSYLCVLWCAWYPVYADTQPDILGWD